MSKRGKNAACVPVIRKSLHDVLTKKTMTLITVEDWSAHKLMMHPTRSEANVDSFTKAGRIYRSRALLECEKRCFNKKTEKTFAESHVEVTMKLTYRGKSMLILVKRTCWSTSAFNNVDTWKYYKVELKLFCIKYYF